MARTKTSLCDDIVSVENGNEYYYTSSGMKKGNAGILKSSDNDKY